MIWLENGERGGRCGIIPSFHSLRRRHSRCRFLFLRKRRSARLRTKTKEAAAVAPDISGVWFVDEYHRTILPKEDPPFQPWAEALFKQRQVESSNRTPDSGPDPTERCIPPGIPRTMFQPFPWEIVQTRDRVIMIFEYQSLIRQIFTDGRGHPKDLEPTYMGNAIGKFEGDTFVIDIDRI